MNILRQTEKPAFPDLSWSKPENKRYAGKLLIIGGNMNDIARISEASSVAYKEGAGSVRILIPSSLQKFVGISEDVFYAAGNPSGGFAKEALGEWLQLADWADMVLLPGELGRNSETAIVLESFVKKYEGPLTITRDAIDQLQNASALLDRPQTTLVLSFAQLQKLLAHHGVTVSLSMPLQAILSECHQELPARAANIVSLVHDACIVISGKQASTTSLREKAWRLITASRASVWTMHFPTQQFEALTSAVFEQSKS